MDATRDLQPKTIRTGSLAGRLGHPAVSDPSPVTRMTLSQFAVVTAPLMKIYVNHPRICPTNHKG